MDGRVIRLLKRLGLWKSFIVIMLLRAPFDFLNAVLGANMLESFIRLIENGEEDRLLSNFWIFLLFTVLLFGYNVTVWSTISVSFEMRFQRVTRMKMLEVMLQSTQQDMERYSAGDWISRLCTDIDKLMDYMMSPVNFMHGLIATVNLVFSSIVLLVINGKLLAAALIVMVPFFIISSVILIRKIPYFRLKSRESYARYTNWMEPIITAGDVINVFEGQELVLQKVRETSEKIMRDNMKAYKRSAWSSFFQIFSGNLGYLLLLIMGNVMMGKEIGDFARLTKITQYRGEMMRSVMIVNTCLNRMRTNLAGAVRVDEILGE
jgi:ABC-type multidrug transport system fused ATPase/permease subunit